MLLIYSLVLQSGRWFQSHDNTTFYRVREKLGHKMSVLAAAAQLFCYAHVFIYLFILLISSFSAALSTDISDRNHSDYFNNPS